MSFLIFLMTVLWKNIFKRKSPENSISKTEERFIIFILLLFSIHESFDLMSKINSIFYAIVFKVKILSIPSQSE